MLSKLMLLIALNDNWQKTLMSSGRKWNISHEVQQHVQYIHRYFRSENSGRARTPWQPGHFQITKLVRQVIRSGAKQRRPQGPESKPKGPKARPVGPREGLGSGKALCKPPAGPATPKEFVTEVPSDCLAFLFCSFCLGIAKVRAPTGAIVFHPGVVPTLSENNL